MTPRLGVLSGRHVQGARQDQLWLYALGHERRVSGGAPRNWPPTTPSSAHLQQQAGKL